jgi:hypothetical protein
VRRPWRAAALACAAALGAALSSCNAPNSHFTRLWPDGESGDPIIGLSTEDGVLVLATPDIEVGKQYEIQFPVGNSFVRDWGRVDRLNDTFAVVRPITARLHEGRIATSLPGPGEQIYLALRDDMDEQEIEEVERWRDGEAGDWVVLPGFDAEEVARDWRGAGLYVDRDGRWQIVGMLAGLTAWDESDPDEVALGFVGLQEMARILPDRLFYLEHDVRPLRPDFEFGVPLQPGDIDLEKVQEKGAPPTQPKGS